MPINVAVSYTHLDVYKRQVYLYRDEQDDGKKLRRRKMYNDTWEQDYMEFVEGNSLTPVSYTHLDVYKRQVLLWLKEI